MSYYFDNNNRYQIVYPFTSDKIHVESNISNGAYRCYQEIIKNNVKTYIFIVHDIDADKIYYFNIPKYKNIEKSTNDNTLIPGTSQSISQLQSQLKSQSQLQSQSQSQLHSQSQSHNNPTIEILQETIDVQTNKEKNKDKVSADQTIQDPMDRTVQVLMDRTIQIPNNQMLKPLSTQTQIHLPFNAEKQKRLLTNDANNFIKFENNTFDKTKQNEIITRLNNVEYQLEVIKKNIMFLKPKKEENGCLLM